MTNAAADPAPWAAGGPSVILLVGASASGKSSWTRARFRETEIVSSDRCRALVADDESNQRVSHHAFAVFYELVYRRCAVGRRTVADSTGLDPQARWRIREIAASFAMPVHALVLLASLPVMLERNRRRGRRVPEDVLVRQVVRLDRLLGSGALEREGYASVSYLATG